MLLKFALLDDSDRRGVELFKRDLQKYKKLLSKEFDESNRIKNRSITKYVIEPPYIALTPKVKLCLILRQKSL